MDGLMALTTIDPIEAAASITYSEHVDCVTPWAAASEEEREVCIESARRVIAAYRDAEIEALRAQLKAAVNASDMAHQDAVNLSDKLKSAEHQLAECRADAERYRWLTGGGFSKDSYGIYWRRTFSRLCVEWEDCYARKLDEAIDKARGHAP